MIREIREKAGMSQQAVASAVGVERSTVAKWESERSNPRAELLPKLAKLFCCSIEELLCSRNAVPPDDHNSTI